MADNDQKKQNDQSPGQLTDAEVDAVTGGTKVDVDSGELKRRKPKYSGTPPVLVPIVVQ